MQNGGQTALQDAMDTANRALDAMPCPSTRALPEIFGRMTEALLRLQSVADRVEGIANTAFGCLPQGGNSALVCASDIDSTSSVPLINGKLDEIFLTIERLDGGVNRLSSL